jgi:two-component system response regulator FixJ
LPINLSLFQTSGLIRLMTSATLGIYVIDDDESARIGLGRLLRSAGFQVEIFGSAQDFLDHGPVENEGLIILDVRMPAINGLELQKRLAAKGSKPPIIFITGFEDPLARDEALKSGAIAFLQKPVDEQTLLGAIEAASQRQANRN